MEERRKFEVFILNKPYVVLSSGEEEVAQLAAFVDEKMREAIEVGHARNHEKAAVLAALNIAQALFKSKKELEGLHQSVEMRASNLLRLIPD